MRIRILLADDHPILIEGLRAILEQHPDIDVIAMAHSGREAVRMSRDQQPDVVVMDVSMPDLNGIEATRQLIAARSKAKVLGLSMLADKRFVAAMLEAGASGYVLKECAVEELIRAIRIVMADQVYLSPAIARLVVDDFRALKAEIARSTASLLTGREREVLQLIAEGHDTKAIAAQLYLSVKTVNTHRERLMDKLQIYSVAKLTKYAIREGLISLDA
jgi:DNA-binding NarL/FixJ family response regulator